MITYLCFSYAIEAVLIFGVLPFLVKRGLRKYNRSCSIIEAVTGAWSCFTPQQRLTIVIVTAMAPILWPLHLGTAVVMFWNFA